MKKLLLLLLCIISVSAAYAATVTINDSNIGTEQLISSGGAPISRTFEEVVEITFTRYNGLSRKPGFYTTDGILRYHDGDKMEISSDYIITRLEFTMYAANPGSADKGNLSGSDNKYTWTGSAKSITFTADENVSSKISSLTITYTTSGIVLPEVTFSPAGGVVKNDSEVSLSLSGNNTTNYTIYYTTNGDTPTTLSTKYTGPITISGNTDDIITVKAIATDGEHTTDAYSTSYTIGNPYVCQIVFADQGWDGNPYSSTNMTKNWVADNKQVFATTFSFNGTYSGYPAYDSDYHTLKLNDYNQIKIDAPENYVIVHIATDEYTSPFNIAEVAETEQKEYDINNQSSITLRPSTSYLSTNKFKYFTITLADAASVPTISADPTTISLEAVNLNGATNTATVNVIGSNLGENIISYSLESGASSFTVSGDLTAAGGELTVGLANTTTKGLFKDNLVITADELMQSVSLTAFVSGLWSVNEIISIANGLNNGETTEYDYSTIGVITKITSAWDPSTKYISYYIANSIDTGNEFLVLQSTCADGAAGKPLKVGDRVSVTGKLALEFGTYKFTTGSTTTYIPAGLTLKGEKDYVMTSEGGQFIARNVKFDNASPNFYIVDASANRYGAATPDITVAVDNAKAVELGGIYPWQIAAGFYDITFDPTNMTISVISKSYECPMISIYLNNATLKWNSPKVRYTHGGETTTVAMQRVAEIPPTSNYARSAEFRPLTEVDLPENSEGKVWEYQLFHADVPEAATGVTFTNDEGTSSFTIADSALANNKIYSSDGTSKDYNDENVSKVENVTVEDFNAAPVYYNLQGARVEQPAAGHIYIEVRGTKVSKVRM